MLFLYWYVFRNSLISGDILLISYRVQGYVLYGWYIMTDRCLPHKRNNTWERALGSMIFYIKNYIILSRLFDTPRFFALLWFVLYVRAPGYSYCILPCVAGNKNPFGVLRFIYLAPNFPPLTSSDLILYKRWVQKADLSVRSHRCLVDRYIALRMHCVWLLYYFLQRISCCITVLWYADIRQQSRQHTNFLLLHMIHLWMHYLRRWFQNCCRFEQTPNRDNFC